MYQLHVKANLIAQPTLSVYWNSEGLLGTRRYSSWMSSVLFCCCFSAADAKKCYATGRGIQPKGVRIGEDAIFKIFTEGAGGGNGEPRVMIMGPGGSPEKNTLTKVDNYYSCVYKPIKPGLYIITVQYAGQPIQKSPFKVEVAPMKMSKIRAFGPGLKTGMVGHPATFRVVPHGEPGQIGK